MIGRHPFAVVRIERCSRDHGHSGLRAAFTAQLSSIDMFHRSPNTRLLCLDLLILLDVDVLVGLEDADLIFGELDTTKTEG